MKKKVSFWILILVIVIFLILSVYFLINNKPLEMVIFGVASLLLIVFFEDVIKLWKK